MHVHTLLFIKTSSIIIVKLSSSKETRFNEDPRSEKRTDRFIPIRESSTCSRSDSIELVHESLLVQRSNSSCAEGACKCSNVPFLSYKSVIVLTQFEFSSCFNLKHYNKLKSVSVLSSDSCKGQFWSSQYRNGRSRAAA